MSPQRSPLSPQGEGGERISRGQRKNLTLMAQAAATRLSMGDEAIFAFSRDWLAKHGKTSSADLNFGEYGKLLNTLRLLTVEEWEDAARKLPILDVEREA